MKVVLERKSLDTWWMSDENANVEDYTYPPPKDRRYSWPSQGASRRILFRWAGRERPVIVNVLNYMINLKFWCEVKNSLVVLTKKKKKNGNKKNAVFCDKKEGLAFFLKITGGLQLWKLSAELAWMSKHWMRELSMYTAPTSGQLSEQQSTEEKRNTGAMWTARLWYEHQFSKSCHTCMATELVEMYAQVHGRIPQHRTCYWFLSLNGCSIANCYWSFLCRTCL